MASKLTSINLTLSEGANMEHSGIFVPLALIVMLRKEGHQDFL